MASKVVATAKAKEDLDSAVSYLADVLFDYQAAKSLYEKYVELTNLLKQFPELFPVSDDFELAKRGYRKAPLGNYLALYIYKNNLVTIVRIFHQIQDYAKLV